MSEQLKGTESAKDAIQRVKYSHDAMIDLLMAEPGITQNKIGLYFGYTAGWVSRVMNSDAFQARLATRKADIVDPLIVANFEDRVKGLAVTSLNIIQKKLDLTENSDLAVKAFEMSTKALGMGARPANVQQTNNFVVALPSKVHSETEWAAGALASRQNHTMISSGVNAVPSDRVIDVEPRQP